MRKWIFKPRSSKVPAKPVEADATGTSEPVVADKNRNSRNKRANQSTGQANWPSERGRSGWFSRLKKSNGAGKAAELNAIRSPRARAHADDRGEQARRQGTVEQAKTPKDEAAQPTLSAQELQSGVQSDWIFRRGGGNHMVN